jgi:acetyl esterase/lipase
MNSSLPLMLLPFLFGQLILNPQPIRRYPYGTDQYQFGELRMPQRSGPVPVAIVIHGGCWMSEYDMNYMRGFREMLTEAGIATWLIEYRRIGNPGGGMPGTFDDVEAAAAKLAEISKEWPIDGRRVVAVGHSAGGQLALWLAKKHGGLRGVVSIAGVLDLRAAATQGACQDATKQLMESADYAKYSPIEMAPIKTRTILIHGAQDRHIPVDFSQRYEAAARKAGDDVKLKVIDGADHFAPIQPATPAFAQVRDAVLSLVK